MNEYFVVSAQGVWPGCFLLGGSSPAFFFVLSIFIFSQFFPFPGMFLGFLLQVGRQ